MISPSYKIIEFVDSILEKDYWDIIYLAEREATEAERHLYRPEFAKTAGQKGARHYVNVLKMLIFFLRNGVRPRGLGDQERELFRSLCESISSRQSIDPLCSRACC